MRSCALTKRCAANSNGETSHNRTSKQDRHIQANRDRGQHTNAPQSRHAIRRTPA